MCVEWSNDWEIAQNDITAYKFVRKVKGRFGKARYESPLQLKHRLAQGAAGVGSVLEYKIGKEITSDSPGIYCIEHAVKLQGDDVCLEVVIPKGASFRRGRSAIKDANGQVYELPTINALRVIPKRICGDKDQYKALRPTRQSYTPMMWNYVTACSTTSVQYMNFSCTATTHTWTGQ